MGPAVYSCGISSGSGKSLLTLLHLLLWPALGVPRQIVGPPLNCSGTCLCASNIISCSNVNLTHIPSFLPKYTTVLDLSFNSITRLNAEWTPIHLSRLQKLLLNNNGLNFLSSEAFVHVTKLRYLDLSFNGLRQLDELIFEPLEQLEVLLLYKNNISQIDRSAFSGLELLQRLYMSHNQISRLPMELVKEQSRLENLKLLDVSSNRIKNLPMKDLLNLPAWIADGVYFHSNPVTCSCDLYNLVARWRLKELNSVVDFKSSHTCLIGGSRRDKMLILDLDKAYLNCSEIKGLKEEAYLEQSLVLSCDTRWQGGEKRWELPGNIPLSQSNKTAVMRSDGSLRIDGLKVEDSGVYTCHATSESYSETLYVTVVVYNFTTSGGLENLNTAYTTLVGCLVSLVMVIVYVYVTPCHSARCSGQDLEKEDSKGSICSSTASLSRPLGEFDQQNTEADGSPHGHAAAPEQNGKLNPIGEEDEEWHGDQRGRRRSDAESVSSDTPMMA